MEGCHDLHGGLSGLSLSDVEGLEKCGGLSTKVKEPFHCKLPFRNDLLGKVNKYFLRTVLK